MPELERLRADHAEAVLAFESANRAYFAMSISDRGDEYFETFTERHRALLAEQDAGIGAYYVLVDDDGAVLGRFNLVVGAGGFVEVGPAEPSDIGGKQGSWFQRDALYPQISPASCTHIAICTRLVTPSLSNSRDTCALTVGTER